MDVLQKLGVSLAAYVNLLDDIYNMIRFMKPSNQGTVNAVSPWAGL